MKGTNTSSRLAELTASISYNTDIVDKYLQENNLKQPSFDEDAFDQDFSSLPPAIVAARAAALDAIEELQDLLREPQMNIQEKSGGRGQVFCQFVARFDIPRRVPIHGSKSYTDLAKETGVNESVLRHILGAAVAHRMFIEQTPGQISHSSTSRLLVERPHLVSSLQTATDDFWPATVRAVDAIEKWPACQEQNQTGAALFHDTQGKGYYEWLMDQPERAQRFQAMMRSAQQREDMNEKHTIDNFAWDKVRTAVDIGGSTGHIAFALAERYPNLKITVQDLPYVITSAEERPGLNVTFQGHDFFDEQPVCDADVYFIRWTLHNWSDKYALRILRALVPALKRGARLLIIDEVLPATGEVSFRTERALRHMDMIMRSSFNAGIRTLDEWKALLHEADARFRFDKFTSPSGSQLSLIEAVWDL